MTKKTQQQILTFITFKHVLIMQGFFFCVTHSQWNLGDFDPNFEKKSQSSKKVFYHFQDLCFVYF